MTDSIQRIRERQAARRQPPEPQGERDSEQWFAWMLDEAEGDIATLLAHLERYGFHEADCAAFWHVDVDYPRTCGWTELSEPSGEQE